MIKNRKETKYIKSENNTNWSCLEKVPLPDVEQQ
jgi:hypothetical protein